MTDPRIHRQHLGASDVETAPTGTDLIETQRSGSRKAIEVDDLFSRRPNDTPQALTASGAIDANAHFVTLSSTTPKIEATIAAPAPGRFLVITQLDGGTAGHTVTLTAGTWDGSNDIATFNAAGETLVVYGVTATRFVIVENIGAVGLSGA